MACSVGVERRRTAPQGQKGVLRHLLGQGGLRHDPAGERVDEWAEPLDDRPERLLIALQQPVDESRMGPGIHAGHIVSGGVEPPAVEAAPPARPCDEA